jgi:hypothetical protein
MINWVFLIRVLLGSVVGKKVLGRTYHDKENTKIKYALFARCGW